MNLSNYNAIEYMHRLRILNLSFNKIYVIEKFKNVIYLEELNLEGNLIEAIENLEGILNLHTLNLAKNKIQNI
jgi:Leucine-rich repeat (LRR) protein